MSETQRKALEAALEAEKTVALVELTPLQQRIMEWYPTRLDHNDLAVKVFNQQLKGLVSSAITSAKMNHSDAVSAGQVERAKHYEELIFKRVADLKALNWK